MSAHHLETLDHSFQLAHEWINELDHALGWNDKHRSYRLLCVVLQTLRDCLPVPEAAQFAAQLPFVLRGTFYEGWRPGAKQARHWDLDRFFARIDQLLGRNFIEDIGDAVQEVFGVIEDRISWGEIENVLQCLPADIRALWPGVETVGE